MTVPVLRLEADQYTAGTRHLPHHHQELQISLVLRGEVEERVGSSVARGRSLSVVVKDPGVRHSDEFGARGAFMARLTIPRTEFGQLVEDETRATPWRWTHDLLAAKPFLRLLNRRNAGACSFGSDDADVIDLLAAISARPARPAAAPPAWLARCVDEIIHAWAPGLTVRHFSARVGVHPVYLARCIRRWFGISTSDLIRAARLRRAADALVDGDESVSRVAHRAGFADEAHLNRTMRASVGVTPAALRRATRLFQRG